MNKIRNFFFKTIALAGIFPLALSLSTLTSCSFKRPYMHIAGPMGSIFQNYKYEYLIDAFGIYNKDIATHNFIIDSYNMDDTTGEMTTKDDTLYSSYFNPLSDDVSAPSHISFENNVPHLVLMTKSVFPTSTIKGFYLTLSFHIDRSLPFSTTTLLYTFSDPGYVNVDIVINKQSDPAQIAIGSAAPLPYNPGTSISTTDAIKQSYLSDKTPDQGDAYIADCVKIFRLLNADMASVIDVLPALVQQSIEISLTIVPDWQFHTSFRYHLSDGEIDKFEIDTMNLNVQVMGMNAWLNIDFNMHGTYILKGIFDATTTKQRYKNDDEFNKFMATLDASGYGHNLWYLVPKDTNAYYEYHLSCVPPTMGIIANLVNGMMSPMAHREFESKIPIYGSISAQKYEWGLTALSYRYKNYNAPNSITPVNLTSLSFNPDDFATTARAPLIKQTQPDVANSDGFDYTDINVFHKYICSVNSYQQSGWDFSNNSMKIENPHSPMARSLMILNPGTSNPYTITTANSEDLPYYQVLVGTRFTEDEQYDFSGQSEQPTYDWNHKPYMNLYINPLYCVNGWNSSYKFPSSSTNDGDGSQITQNSYYYFPDIGLYTFPILSNGDSPIAWSPV